MEKFKDIQGYIFDLDGTLFDSMQVWMEIYKSLFTEHGKTMPEGYLYHVNHLSLDDGAKYTAEHTDVNLSKEYIAEFWKKKAQDKYTNEVKLKPYAYELLNLLSQKGKLMGIATASNKDNVRPCLVNNDIIKFFHSITSVDEVPRGKDFPDIYLKECQKMGLEPKHCAVVEDSYVGALSAKNGGLLSIGVYDESGKEHNKDLRKNCDIYIDSLKELLELV